MNNSYIDLGFIQIYWYSIFIIIGVLIGIFLTKIESERIHFNKQYIIDVCFYMLIPAVIGARLYYVIFNFKEFENDLLSILFIRDGGIAIYGAILGGLIFIYYYAIKKKESSLKTIDILIPSLILGQAIGRWGNFFNGEAYGQIVTRAKLVSMYIPEFIIKKMYINGLYYEPTFLYESLWCFIGFIILLLCRYLYKKKRLGFLTGVYALWYGIGRFIIEGHRSDSLYLMDFRISQLVSILLIMIGLYLIFNKRIKKYYEERVK